jgi:hypothetical protein
LGRQYQETAASKQETQLHDGGLRFRERLDFIGRPY